MKLGALDDPDVVKHRVVDVEHELNVQVRAVDGGDVRHSVERVGKTLALPGVLRLDLAERGPRPRRAV